MVHKYEIQGGPPVGYTKRCPHYRNRTETTANGCGRAGRTVTRPLFVGNRGCLDCPYNLNRYAPPTAAARFVYCSYPAHVWEVPAGDLLQVRNGGEPSGG